MKMENLTDLANFLRSLHETQTVEVGIDANYSQGVREIFYGTSDKIHFGFDIGLGETDADATRHPCGTACCIGGWVALLRPELSNVGGLSHRIMALDPSVSEYEADDLCFPVNIDHYQASALQAAIAVEILRDTGKCDWEKAMELGK